MTDANSEKRQFFRLDNEVEFKYLVLDSDEHAFNSTHTSLFKPDQKKQYDLLRCLHQHQTRSKHLLSEIQEAGSLKIAQYLSSLEQLFEDIAKLGHQSNPDDVRRLNLSIGGLAFFEPNPIKIDSLLEIKLAPRTILFPFLIRAKVVSCVPTDEDVYRISVRFENMSDVDSQRLQQYIFQQESKAQQANEDGIAPPL